MLSGAGNEARGHLRLVLNLDWIKFLVSASDPNQPQCGSLPVSQYGLGTRLVSQKQSALGLVWVWGRD